MNQVYVAHNDSNNVAVIDGAANAVVAAIAVGLLPDGLSVNPQTNRVYVANRQSNSVTVLAVRHRLPTTDVFTSLVRR